MATLNSEIILVKNIRLDKDYINVLFATYIDIFDNRV